MAADRTEATARGGASRGRGTRYYASDSRSGAVMTGSLADAIAKLHADLRDKATRSAAFAGAKVLFNEMRARVPVAEGVLFGSLYTWHDDEASRGGKQLYLIGPNKREAGHWHHIEYGHWRINVIAQNAQGEWIATKERLATPVWMPAVPYVRPTWDAKGAEALQAARQRLAERVRELQSGAA